MRTSAVSMGDGTTDKDAATASTTRDTRTLYNLVSNAKPASMVSRIFRK